MHVEILRPVVGERTYEVGEIVDAGAWRPENLRSLIAQNRVAAVPPPAAPAPAPEHKKEEADARTADKG